MNIKSTAYEDTISIELSPDDFYTRSISTRAIIDSSGGICAYVSTKTAIAMRDKLNEIFPPEQDEPELGLPEEPKESGYYLTPQNELLIRDKYGNWYRPGNYTWKDDCIYTDNWILVYETLGDGAFPLTRLNTGKEH